MLYVTNVLVGIVLAVVILLFLMQLLVYRKLTESIRRDIPQPPPPMRTRPSFLKTLETKQKQKRG